MLTGSGVRVLETVLPVILALSAYLFFLIYLPRLTPPDVDSANHLRLAQLWTQGIEPSHPYGFGVKWALPRVYRLLFTFLSKNWNRYRLVLVVQSTFTHLAIPYVGFLQTAPLWLIHVALFLLNISPLVFPLTSSMDIGTVVFYWLAISTLFLDTTARESWLVAAVGIMIASFLWKIVDLIYVIPILGSLLVGFYQADLASLVFVALLFGAVAIAVPSLLRNQRVRQSLFQKVSYRASRTMFRKKVVWPFFVFFGIATALISVAKIWGEEILDWRLLGLMGVLAAARNIISGDFVTGPGSYHLYFPLFVFACSSGVVPLAIFVIGFFFLALMAFFSSSSKNIGHRMRMVSQGGRFPNDADAHAQKVSFCNRFGDSGSDAVLVGTDSLLSLDLNLAADSGYAYTSIHSEQWGIARSDAQLHLGRGNRLILSGLLESDLQKISGLVDVVFETDPLTGVTVASKGTSGDENSLD